MTRNLLVSLGFVCWMLAVSGAGAATIKVKGGDSTPDVGGCGSGANPCNTIQAGVDNASPGDIVKVSKGDYPESVLIETDGITVKGGTLVDGDELSCPGDPTRISLAHCSDIDNQLECEASWHITGNGNPNYAASCYWDGASCRGCGPSNEGDGNCTNSCDGRIAGAITVSAANVTIDKVRARGPVGVGVSVTPGSTGTMLKGVRVEGAGNSCILALGDDTTILSPNLRACERDCVEVWADDVTVSKARIQSCDDDGIFGIGQRITLQRNNIQLADDDCIDLQGDEMLIDRNRLRGCGGDGIESEGSEGTIFRNKINAIDNDGIDFDCKTYQTSCDDVSRTNFVGGPETEACRQFDGNQSACEEAWALSSNGAVSCYYDGVDCRGCGENNEQSENCTNTCVDPADRCSDSLISSNTVTDSADDECFAVDAEDAGLLVEKNKGSFCLDEGFDVDGIGIELVGNSITDCGGDESDSGFEIDGEDHILESNKVLRCSGDGFEVDEDAINVLLEGNSATDNGQDGFDVQENAIGTTIIKAVAKNNILGGIAVRTDAMDTTITDSSASGNLLDFCDEGTNTVETGNKFGTTGACLRNPNGNN